MMPIGFSPGALLLMLGIMLMMGLASRNVQRTFQKFQEVPIRRRMTGAQAARYILDQNGLHNIPVERVQGELTDHYDPSNKVLRLSEPVHDSASVSAVGVAAHEAGHAIQDKVGYWPLVFRQSFYPIASFSSNIGMFMIMIGFFFSLSGGPSFLAVLGLLLYAAGIVLTVVTLPVEFNASSRALACLQQYGLVTDEENGDTRKVLNAAAMTYVASALAAILTLLYYAMLIFGGSEE